MFYHIRFGRFGYLFFACLLIVTACGSDSSVPADTASTPENTDTNLADQTESSVIEINECISTKGIDSPATASTRGVIPIPIDNVFWDETTVLLELFVFRKEMVCQSTFVESHQVDRSTIIAISDEKAIGDSTPIAALEEISRETYRYVGIINEDDTTTNEYPICSEEYFFQPFIYVARTTKSNGETVTIVNEDVCGQLPNFQFDDIDGASTSYRSLAYLRDEFVRELN